MSTAAIILVGGMGTRLRPLTLTQPKALMPVLNKPFIAYQFELLARSGIRRAVLAANVKLKPFAKQFKAACPKSLQLEFVYETKPLGTGGAIRFAFEQVKRKLSKIERFAVFNGDVLFDLPLTDFLNFHQSSGAACSIALTRVSDPSRFGLVETDGDGRVQNFLEKPQSFRGEAFINAGAYIFETATLAAIPAGREVSVEREVYPQFLEEQVPIFGFKTHGYWNDIGTPSSYLQAHVDLVMNRQLFTPDADLRKSTDPLRGKNLKIARDVLFRNMVCLADNVEVRKGVVLEDTIVLSGSKIGEGCRIKGAIVGRRVKIGNFCEINPGVVIGDNSVLSDFTRV